MGKEKSSDKRNLTELEGTVLGLVGIKGPCTPYQIRIEFKQSPSPYWSGSAGAIYPIIERLADQKLIEHVSTKDNLRGGKLYVLTKTGEKKLESWLYQPTSPVVVGIPPDFLRNRIELLAFLTPEVRRNFLRDVAAELENQLEVFFRDCEKARNIDLFAYLSARGSLLHAQARVNWIHEIIDLLDKKNSIQS
jgi:DNA-binding PadR family transcriptional regulator